MRFVWAVLIVAAIPAAAELGYDFTVELRHDPDVALAAFYADHRDAIAAVLVRWFSLGLLVHTLAWRNAAFMAAFFAAAVAAANVAVIELAFGVDAAIVQHDAVVRAGLAVLFAVAAWATATFVRAPD
jgi:hypothetical protein